MEKPSDSWKQGKGDGPLRRRIRFWVKECGKIDKDRTRLEEEKEALKAKNELLHEQLRLLAKILHTLLEKAPTRGHG